MNEDEGFTLIELMVVVLIIAILIAIAIPTFLGARERAQDRAAQSSLRNALTAAKTIFTDDEDYTQATATELQASEPSLCFLQGADCDGAALTTSDDPVDVVLAGATVLDQNLWIAGAYSNSGTCFYIRDNTQGPGTEFGSEDATNDDCTQGEVDTFQGSGTWESSW